MHPLPDMNFTLVRNNLSEPGNLIYEQFQVNIINHINNNKIQKICKISYLKKNLKKNRIFK